MLKRNWEEFWEKISIGRTPSTTPINENFWRLLPRESLIIEVGCGWGRIIFECLKRNFEVVGIDINKNEVEALNKRLLRAGLNDKAKIYNENIKNTSFKNETFSAAIMQGILSAIPASARDVGLAEVYRILKHGGYIHVAEFELITNNSSAMARYKSDELTTKEFGTLSVKGDKGQEVYRTHNFLEKELRELLVKNGFNITSLIKKDFISYHGNKKPGLLIIAQKV